MTILTGQLNSAWDRLDAAVAAESPIDRHRQILPIISELEELTSIGCKDAYYPLAYALYYHIDRPKVDSTAQREFLSAVSVAIRNNIEPDLSYRILAFHFFDMRDWDNVEKTLAKIDLEKIDPYLSTRLRELELSARIHKVGLNSSVSNILQYAGHVKSLVEVDILPITLMDAIDEMAPLATLDADLIDAITLLDDAYTLLGTGQILKSFSRVNKSKM